MTNVNTNVALSTVDVNEATDTDAMDQFGRTEAERTVVLGSVHAQDIDAEVSAGKHQTYDDALAHVLTRGLAEIARARKAAEELRQARIVKERGKVYSEMLKMNPALVANPDFVAKMIAELGVKTTA